MVDPLLSTISIIIHNFGKTMPISDKYCRTTAQGRHFWEAAEALICALVPIVESNWFFRMEDRRWVEEGGRCGLT